MKNYIGSCNFDERYSNLGGMLAIDTITVDRYSRLTLTKEVKNNLHIEAGDKIAVYRDKYDPDELLFRIQRGTMRKDLPLIQSFLPIRMGTGLVVVRTVLLNIDLTPKIEPEISCLWMTNQMYSTAFKYLFSRKDIMLSRFQSQKKL
jgi:hypothetical protein